MGLEMTYAKGTVVSAEKSRLEIERIVERYGASGFYYGAETNRAIIGFTAHGRTVKMMLPLPKPTDFKYYKKNKNYYFDSERSVAQMQACCDQAIRERWRALCLAIKAKLEIVESGIASFESEFLAHIMLYDGRTVGVAMAPQIEENYKSGKPIQLLLGAGA